MILKCYDVKCKKCGAIEEDCLLTDAEEPEKCPECGGDRERVYFGVSNYPAHSAGFLPLDVGDGRILNSPAEVEIYKREAAFGCGPNTEVHLEPDSKYDRQVRCDERRHRAWERRKAKGVCDQQLREMAQAPNGRA